MSDYKWGSRSFKRLETCHHLLQELMDRSIAKTSVDITILCGHRDEVEQNEAYRKGYSKLKYPRSKHNKIPSMAVDVVPYPVDWKDLERFEHTGQVILSCWEDMKLENYPEIENYDLFWGKNWTRLVDYPHFQITRKK
jgi:peptidoglycan L-alanyl-D-glutamate endopeptidase CwlK